MVWDGMATGLFLLSVTAPLGFGLVLVLVIALELSSRLRRCQKERDKLRAQRDGLEREVVMLRKRWFGPGALGGRGEITLPASNLDAFNKLRALVIKTLHPDAAPEDSATERDLRSEMFKAVWPEIIKIENGIGSGSDLGVGAEPRYPVAANGSASFARQPVNLAKRRREGNTGWRERRKNTVYS